MKKNNLGISLMTLIITIVAIIIIASIALFTGLNAPDSAAYSKFCNDISQIQDAVVIKYINEYEEKFNSADDLTKELVYQGILKENGKVETIGGITVNEIDGSKIDYDLPEYTDANGNPQTWYVDINTDTVYLLPGYEYEGKVYVTETKDTDSVANSPVVAENSVQISGTLTVGEMLTASLKNGASAGSSLTYSWWYTTVKGSTRGTPISGATSSSYTLTESMERKYIGVTITETMADNTTKQYTGITSSLIGGERIYLAKPTVTGSYTYNGESQNVKLNGFDSVTMSITGQTGKDAGNYTAVVSIKRPNAYEWETGDTEEVSLTWTIEKKDGSTLSLDGVESSYIYTGSQIAPRVTMTNNREILEEGRDYSILYGANTKVGEQGTISITFKGNYKGSRTETFTILTDNITEERIGITGIDTSYTYTGKAIQPVPAITVDGKSVVAGQDYDVTFGNNTSVGQGSVTITFKGNYSGSKIVTFDITKLNASSDNITVNNVSANYEYTASQITPTPEVVVAGTDYDVTYGDNLIAGEGTLKITLKGNYEGSKELKFRIDPKAVNEQNITINNVSESYEYAVSQIKPVPEIIVAGKTLVAGTDYDVAYGENLNIGDGTLTVTFKGNYTGVVTKAFKIIPMKATVSDIIVTNVNAAYDYIGEALEPDPIVTVKGVTLEESKDYKVTYADNTNRGTGKVIITLQNNYSGDKTVEFEIKAQQVNEGSIVISGVDSSYTFTGSQIKPVPVVEVDGVELNEGTDYDISYGENLNKGTGTINITFKGNYSGSTQKTFTIAANSVSSDEITINGVDASYEYRGSQITPEITVVVNEKTLTADDYTVEYGTNKDAGDGSVKVTLKNNQEGSKEVEFVITAKTVTATVGTTTLNYTGSEQKPTVTVSGAVENETINLNVSTTPESAIEPGSYTAEVTIGSVTNGKAGNYTLIGDTTINFSINARISFDANGVSETMEDVYLPLNSTYTLPTNVFTAPSGKLFKGWLINGMAYEEGSEITVNGNITVMAKWATIKPVENLISSNGIQIGDYVNYTPYTESNTYKTKTTGDLDTGISEQTLTRTEGTVWRVIKVDSTKNEIIITPTDVVNTDTKLKLYGAPGYINHKNILNDVSDKLYSNTQLGLTARSMILEDLDYTISDATTGYYAYYPDGTSSVPNVTYNGKTYTGKAHISVSTSGYKNYRFWEYDKADNTVTETINGKEYTYGYPTSNKPVLVSRKRYTATAGTNTTTARALIGSNYGWLASSYVNTATSYSDFYVRYVYSSGMSNYRLAGSSGSAYSDSYGVRPVVPLSYAIKLVESGTKVEEDKTYKVWDIDSDIVKHTISFESNGGSGTMDNISVATGSNYNLPANTFTSPANKEFAGWLVNGETKAIGDIINVSSDMTLTATWKTTQHSVTLVADNGTDEQISVMVNAGENYALPTCTFTAPINKAFAGWSVNGEIKFVGDEITITDAITVTATWSEVALSVTGVAESYEYTGSQIAPEPVVTGNGVELVKGTDYDVTYGENLNAGATKGTVTITFKGAYTGTETIEFTITPKNISSVTMKLDITEYTYDGKAKTPGVTVTDGSLGGLTQGTDYTVAWTKNTKAALSTDANAPTVTITGNNNYTGTKSVTFTIKKANMEVRESNFSGPYDGTAQSATVTVTTPSAGAIIWYKEGTELTSTNYTSGSPTMPTRTDVGNSQIFYYAVAENYNDYSGSVNTVITQRAVTVKADDITRKYNGEELTSTAATASGLADGHKLGTVATNGKITNVGSVDNEITSVTILDASNNDVTNNYAITPVKGTLTITPEDAATFTITVGAYDNVYDGTAKTPTVTVKVGTKTVPESEYIVSHSNNVDEGTTATVTVTGKADGNYAGSEGSQYFTINKRPLTLTAGGNTQVYNGKALTVSTVTSSGLVSGHTLTATTQGSQTNVGSSANTIATYSIKAGSTDVTKNYAITPVDGTLTVTKKTVTVAAGTTTFNYDGYAKKPTATVSGAATDETINLTITTNPTSAINPGTYSATVTMGSVTNGSTSNYTLSGTTTFNFTIKARIAFSANGGTGSMSNQYATLNSSYTLPACAFTAPSGMEFDGWSVSGTTYIVGSQITITGNTTVTAQWKSSGFVNPEGGIVNIVSDSDITNSNYKNNTNISMVLQAPGETTQVPVPTGFTYLTGTGDTGLVITDAEENGNEFVWIPVNLTEDQEMVHPERTLISEMYGTGTYTLAGSTGVKTTKYGKHNAKDSDGNLKYSMTTPGTTSGYREPDLVTSYDLNTSNLSLAGFTGTNAAKLFATDLVNEFDSMITSVEKYGGFFVGRYELGYSDGVVCKPGVTVLTASDSEGTNFYGSSTTKTWYGLYKASKTFTQGGVSSSMIWGCQWDAMVNFIGDHTGTGTDSIYLTGANEYADKYKNVYDTATGAVYEFTSVAADTNYRGVRGGVYYSVSSANGRGGYNPANVNTYSGSRPQLYIKVNYTIVDGTGADGKHYHNDELFTGTCGGKTYVDGVVQSGGCFLPGTKILMSDGTTKNIEDVQIGDKVMSYDRHSEAYYTARVNQTIEKEVDIYYEIKLEDGTIVRVTGKHPFLTDEGFENIMGISDEVLIVGVLEVGDKVMTTEGYKPIVAIIEYNEKKKVYNLNVADDDEIQSGEDDDSDDTYIVEGIVCHNIIHS